MGVEMFYKLYEKVMFYVFNKDTRSSFEFVPTIKIGFWEMKKMDFEADLESVIFISWYIKNWVNPFIYENHDVFVKNACSNKKWYGFMVPGWYGEEIAKILVLTGIVYFL